MKYPIPLWRRLVLKALRVKVTYRRETLELLETGRAIVVCNHQSFLDGPIIGLASPTRMCFPISNKQSVDNRLTKHGLRFLGLLGLGEQVAMNGDHPFGVRALLKKIDQSVPIMIFPEGRICGPSEQVEPKPGYRWLVEKSGVPVVEIGLKGADQSRLFAPEGAKRWPLIELEF